MNLVFKYSIELFKMACTWLDEICSCCSLTVLPVPAWVLLNYICSANHFEELRIILSISAKSAGNIQYIK